jgi:hypothetical protein
MAKIKGYQFDPAQGWLGAEPIKDTYKYMIVDDRIEKVKELVVHEFTLGDVDDPDLYAAQPLWDWQQSSQGQWIMKNAIEPPSWHRVPDMMQFGYKFQVRAKLMGARLTEYLLRQER